MPTDVLVPPELLPVGWGVPPAAPQAASSNGPSHQGAPAAPATCSVAPTVQESALQATGIPDLVSESTVSERTTEAETATQSQLAGDGGLPTPDPADGNLDQRARTSLESIAHQNSESDETEALLKAPATTDEGAFLPRGHALTEHRLFNFEEDEMYWI